MTEMVTRALALATKLHFAVFPIYPMDGEGCACGKEGCTSPGKHPLSSLVPNGLLNASADPADIKQWWALYPDANIGIRTGEASDITVVDIDPDKGGARSWHNIQERHGQFPPTWTVKTGSGGYHYYYQYDQSVKTRADVMPGIDTRSDGGYVVAPHSIHASGNRYAWEVKPNTGTELAFLPDQLLQILGVSKERSFAEIIPETISDGSRNTWLASAGGTMRRRGFSPESVKAALRIENNLKCRPPLDDDEVDLIAWSISRYPAGVT